MPLSIALTCALAAICGGTDTQTEGESPFRDIHVEDGVFRYDDGTEVALFGTNYYPMAWYQFTNMKTTGADFRREIARDLEDMKSMGVEVVRVHFFDRQHTNRQGDLIENEALTVFDIFVDELDRQGLYFYLTPLTWWSSPIALDDAIAANTSKMGMMYVEEAVAASETYLAQLLTRRNPFTGRRLVDEPALAVIEIFNEPWYWPYEAVSDPEFEPGFLADQTTPEVFERDLAYWIELWETYCREKGIEPNRDVYADFQYEHMTRYLDQMITAIRDAGATQPIASALFETYRNPGILRAIAKSDVEAVSDGWYIGGFDTLHEGVNLLEDPMAESYQLPDSVADKARIVYEWDVCRTYNTVGMYPALARRWRSMGAQIVCHFQYDAAATAPFNTDWGVHYLNYEATPAKAAAFLAASRAFAAIPRGEQYPTEPDNVVFHHTAISFEHNQVLHITEDTVIHAHPMGDWAPLDLPESPQHITGRGDSPYVEYTGSGLYHLDRIEPELVRLRTTRNAEPTAPIDNAFFDHTGIGLLRVEFNITPERFRLLLPGWEHFTCTTLNGIPVPVKDGAFEVIPGETYLLHAE